MDKLIKISDFITPELINMNLKSTSKDEVLKELSLLLSKSPNVNEENSKIVYKALVDREKLGSTGIGKGVAIPHAKTDIVTNLTVAFGILKKPINFDSIDGEPVNIFFAFASPNRDSQVYLKVLARISRFIREDAFRQALLQCDTPADVFKCLDEKENA